MSTSSRLSQDASGPEVGTRRNQAAGIPPDPAGPVGKLADVWLPALLVSSVVASVFSIFAADLLFGLAFCAWGWLVVRTRRIGLRLPPFFGYLAILLGAVLLSILFSEDRWESAIYLKKQVWILWVILLFTYLRPKHLRLAFHLLFGALVLSSVYGFAQYFWLKDIDLLHRITGLMSHWMTFSGQLMLGSIALAGYLVFARPSGLTGDAAVRPPYNPLRRPLGLAALLLLSGALLLSMTRSSWVGCLLGVFLVLALARPLWAAACAVVLSLVFLALPSDFQTRLYSSFDPRDTTNRVRMELLKTGKNIIVENPLTGLGPRMVRRSYVRYRTTQEFPGWAYQHLHNNAVQIASEMGLITLVGWVLLWIKIIWDLAKLQKRALAESDYTRYWLALNGIACIVAFLCAGLFEYNYGDSEILILLLFMLTAPYVADHQQEKRA